MTKLCSTLYIKLSTDSTHSLYHLSYRAIREYHYSSLLTPYHWAGLRTCWETCFCFKLTLRILRRCLGLSKSTLNDVSVVCKYFSPRMEP
jgi:hypothetical protein